MNNKEQALTLLLDAYYTLVENKLDSKYKELKKAIKEAVKELGGTIPRTPKQPYFRGTETGILAHIHNTLWLFKMTGTGWGDDELEAFYEIPYLAYEALADVKSTCKKDTEAKIEVIRTQYSDYNLDEIQKIALRTLEHELTGRVGEWGLPNKT